MRFLKYVRGDQPAKTVGTFPLSTSGAINCYIFVQKTIVVENQLLL